MSLFRLDSNYFDTFKVLAKPKRSFVSSSSGITGSIKVFPDASTAVKEVADTSTDITFDDGGLEDDRGLEFGRHRAKEAATMGRSAAAIRFRGRGRSLQGQAATGWEAVHVPFKRRLEI